MATSRKRPRRLADAYTFPGFRPQATVRGVFGDPQARVVTLTRRSKKRFAASVGVRIRVGTIAKSDGYATCPAATPVCTSTWRSGVWRAGAAGKVKRKQSDFLADNPLYTKRFAHYVGRRCASATIKAVAKELRLNYTRVKELDKQYMRSQLARAGTPGPQSDRHR